MSRGKLSAGLEGGDAQEQRLSRFCRKISAKIPAYQRTIWKKFLLALAAEVFLSLFDVIWYNRVVLFIIPCSRMASRLQFTLSERGCDLITECVGVDRVSACQFLVNPMDGNYRRERKLFVSGLRTASKWVFVSCILSNVRWTPLRPEPRLRPTSRAM